MSAANGLIFDGFDLQAHPGSVLFKGPFSGKYALSADTAAFKVNHGQWVKCQRGPREGQVGVVAGVLDKCLWVFFLAEGVAMPLKGAASAAELTSTFDLVSCTPNVSTSTMAQGPLGSDYTLDISTLSDKYGLRKDERFSLHGTTNVAAVGELFGCLWVKHSGGNQCAVPLQGATSEATLHELYAIGEPSDPMSATGVSTPRRTPSTTPRSTKPPFVLDTVKQVASCQAAFGNTLVVATSRKALAQWGLTHGQTFRGAGPNAGKQVTIVGANMGAVYIHIEGDKRVTCCRNCETGTELAEAYGFGSGGTKQKDVTPTPTEKSPERAASEKKKPASTPNAATRPAAPTEVTPPTRKSTHKKVVFSMWTSFGRQEFDISLTGTKPFGFHHGATVKATQGADKDLTFTVVGENGGVLWVVQEGKPRAVALRHCHNKEDIMERYGFLPDGKKDISYLAQVEQEPAFTPINTPRGGSALSPMTPRGAGGQQQAAPSVETPRGMSTSYANAPVPSNTPSNVPALNFGALASPPVAEAIRSLPLGSSGSQSAPPLPQSSSCHRNYLKAVALLKTGAHSNEDDKLRFHKYYMVQTAERLNHAMSKINVFRDVYGGSDFERASCNEMLETMRKRAEMFV